MGGNPVPSQKWVVNTEGNPVPSQKWVNQTSVEGEKKSMKKNSSLLFILSFLFLLRGLSLYSFVLLFSTTLHTRDE